MLTRPQRFRAEQLSSYVNETHKMLLNPVAHAEYILGLNGVEIGEEEHVDDQEFIMDIFEQRSDLEDCESPDAAKQLSDVNQGTCDISVCNYDPLVDHLAVKANEISSQLSKAIQHEAWQQAKELTIRLKYLRSIISAANAWPDTTSDH
jgi:molecular chaperone HscB